MNYLNRDNIRVLESTRNVLRGAHLENTVTFKVLENEIRLAKYMLDNPYQTIDNNASSPCTKPISEVINSKTPINNNTKSNVCSNGVDILDKNTDIVIENNNNDKKVVKKERYQFIRSNKNADVDVLYYDDNTMDLIVKPGSIISDKNNAENSQVKKAFRSVVRNKSYKENFDGTWQLTNPITFTSFNAAGAFINGCRIKDKKPFKLISSN